MKIGIMGGTFNPIHHGHLIIAEQAKEEFQLDLVLFIPAGVPPHKQNEAILDGKHRCSMIEVAIKNNPNFLLDTREIESDAVSYTYLTLKALKQQYNEAELYFIMGEDSIYAVSNWKCPQEIFSMTTVLVAVRNHLCGTQQIEEQIQLIKQQYNGTIAIIHSPVVLISSSLIRERIALRYSIRYLVPDSVVGYIEDYELYQMER